MVYNIAGMSRSENIPLYENMGETVVVALLAFLLLGAMAFYFYARITYTEKKIGLLESILLDIKLTMEAEEHSTWGHGVKPKGVASSATPAPAPAPAADAEDESADAEYYNSVLESAAADVSGMVVSEGLDNEIDVIGSSSASDLEDYDSMTRDELGALAEKRGVRVTKRMSKLTVINLLREADKNSSVTQESGKDAVEGSSAALGSMEGMGGGAPLDMESDVQV